MTIIPRIMEGDAKLRQRRGVSSGVSSSSSKGQRQYAGTKPPSISTDSNTVNNALDNIDNRSNPLSKSNTSNANSITGGSAISGTSVNSSDGASSTANPASSLVVFCYICTTFGMRLVSSLFTTGCRYELLRRNHIGVFASTQTLDGIARVFMLHASGMLIDFLCRLSEGPKKLSLSGEPGSARSSPESSRSGSKETVDSRWASKDSNLNTAESPSDEDARGGNFNLGKLLGNESPTDRVGIQMNKQIGSKDDDKLPETPLERKRRHLTLQMVLWLYGVVDVIGSVLILVMIAKKVGVFDGVAETFGGIVGSHSGAGTHNDNSSGSGSGSAAASSGSSASDSGGTGAQADGSNADASGSRDTFDTIFLVCLHICGGLLFAFSNPISKVIPSFLNLPEPSLLLLHSWEVSSQKIAKYSTPFIVGLLLSWDGRSNTKPNSNADLNSSGSGGSSRSSSSASTWVGDGQ